MQFETLVIIDAVLLLVCLALLASANQWSKRFRNAVRNGRAQQAAVLVFVLAGALINVGLLLLVWQIIDAL